MRRLFLLRHAQALHILETNDDQRPLTEHGISQANNLRCAYPDINLALCSTAVRTKETLQNLTHFQIKNITMLDEFYNANAGDLMHHIQQVDMAQSLMIIAHNPGIHKLANILTDAGDERDIRDQIRFDYRPATLTILDCPIERWADLTLGANKLVDVVTSA